MSSTVRLDITRKKSEKEIKSFLEKNKLKKGDTLKIIKDDDTSYAEILGILFLLITSFILFQKLKENNKTISTTIDDLEKFVEKEAGVKIDIEPKPNASSTSHEQLSPRVRRLRGIIAIDENVNYKQILAEELSKKYGV